MSRTPHKTDENTMYRNSRLAILLAAAVVLGLLLDAIWVATLPKPNCGTWSNN